MNDTEHYRLKLTRRVRLAGRIFVPGPELLVTLDRLAVVGTLIAAGAARPADRATEVDAELWRRLRVPRRAVGGP